MRNIIFRANKTIFIFILCTFVVYFGSIGVLAATEDAPSDSSAQENDSARSESSSEITEEKVPVIIEFSEAIAGAEFTLNHTEGLDFISFEKSEATNSALVTPIVNKDGNIHFGFFAADNNYVPQDGKLFVGNLVFNYYGDPDQFATITEVKLVKVIDKDNTESEVIKLNLKVTVPSDGNVEVGENNLTTLLIIFVIVLIAIIAIMLIRRKKILTKN